jgi:chitinase
MGVPLDGVGWAAVPSVNHGWYKMATGPSPVPNANGIGLYPNPDPNAPSPGCDPPLTSGLATYSTLSNLISNGYSRYFDRRESQYGSTIRLPKFSIPTMIRSRRL